jgi:hypothetical protein
MRQLAYDSLFVWVVIAALDSLPSPVCAQEDASPWYDAAPLLTHIRSDHYGDLTSVLGGRRLEDVTLYDLEMSVGEELQSFELRETIYVTNSERAPWPELVLRIYANEAPPHDAVSMSGGRCLDGIGCTITAISPTVIRVRPARPLAPGARLRIQLDLQGRARTIDPSQTTLGAQGMESLTQMMGTRSTATSDYGAVAYGDGIGSFAHFYAVLAPRHDGAWEEQSSGGDLGSHTISHVRARVVMPADAQLVSSGVEVHAAMRDPREERAQREVTLHAGMIRDFSMLMSRAFESISRSSASGVTVRSFYLPAERARGRRVLEVARSALELFERSFGPYPYTELDVAEAPLVGGAGGVEFSSLVTIASMFYRPTSTDGLVSSEVQDAMLEFVTAHEVAHQWWYGLVGSDAREHPWVDESLAQWSAMHWMLNRYGAERAQLEADRQVAINYRMMRMIGLPDAAVARPASAFTPPITYAGLVYGKGPFLYEAIRTELGDEAFFRGLRAYVQQWSFRMAPSRGPIASLATGRHAARVRALARRWLDARHGDEDLGADGSSSFEAMLPPELRAAFGDPATRAAMQQMLPGLMQSLTRTEGGAGPATGDELSPQEAMRALGEMQRMLESLPTGSSP